MIHVFGASELMLELSLKGRRIDGEVFRAQWETANDGAAAAAAAAPKDRPSLAPSIKPGTYAVPGGVRAVWGPTDPHGLYLEKGTAKMPAQPYLGPTAGAVFAAGEQRLADTLEF